jgi:hypothetical protein
MYNIKHSLNKNTNIRITHYYILRIHQARKLVHATTKNNYGMTLKNKFKTILSILHL